MYNKLLLGTAQFGLAYGISNTSGQVEQDEVTKILAWAKENGISALDTAHEYGTSEQAIGAFTTQHPDAFKIISKSAAKTVQELETQFEHSLHTLHTNKLYGFLLHSYAQYKECPSLFSKVLEEKDLGHVEKVGFSLYFPSELEELLSSSLSFDLVQFPYNIFDKRFEYLLPELKKRGVEVHCRSIFLQGLFFLKPKELPTHFKPVLPQLQALQALALQSKIPLNILCLLAAATETGIERILVGVTSQRELEENSTYLEYIEAVEPLRAQLHELRVDDEKIILPIHWKI